VASFSIVRGECCRQTFLHLRGVRFSAAQDAGPLPCPYHPVPIPLPPYFGSKFLIFLCHAGRVPRYIRLIVGVTRKIVSAKELRAIFCQLPASDALNRPLGASALVLPGWERHSGTIVRQRKEMICKMHSDFRFAEQPSGAAKRVGVGAGNVPGAEVNS